VYDGIVTRPHSSITQGGRITLILPISVSNKSYRMPPPLGVGWWKCCKCEREVNKAIHGDDRCPDCGKYKCDQCTDPFYRPSDLADLTTTLSCWFGDIDNPVGLASCGSSQLVEGTTAGSGLGLTEADKTLQSGSLVDSKPSSK
jgi:hypothetical protein